MKFVLKKIIKVCNKLFYPDFNHNDPNYAYLEIFKTGIIQKVFGFNRNVPWPVHFTSRISHPEKIDRGNKTPAYAQGCYLNGVNGIIFGENVWMGPRVTIASVNHDLCDFSKYSQSSPVKIGRNSWLAANCVILAGVELGEHTVVAAGAVVTKSFLEGDILLGGNPAKIIKKLDPYNQNS